MKRLSPDAVAVEVGVHVVSIAEQSVLIVDDGRGHVPEATTARLMASVATGDPAQVREVMTDHRHDVAGAAALVVGAAGPVVVVIGTFAAMAESPGSRQLITALAGDIDLVPLVPTVTTVRLGPAGQVAAAMTSGAGAATARAVRAGRVEVTVAASDASTVPRPPPSPPRPHPLPNPVVAGAEHVESSSDHDASGGAVALPPSSPTAPPGAVMVRGIRCPEGHHNHPEAVYCATCGRRLGINHTVVVGGVLGPRPALGLLLLDDGTTHTIDRNMVVGREPRFHHDVGSGAAIAVEVSDPELNLSREHFVIRLDEWEVTALDLGSSNGTVLRRSGSERWDLLSTSIPTVLGAGDELRAGTRVFTVQLHHIQT